MAVPDPGGGERTWDRLWELHAASNEANPAQAFRRRLIRRLLEAGEAGPGARILDVGCGTGALLAHLADRFEGAAFAGIDLSRIGLEAARKKMPGALLVQGDLEASGAPRELAGWATDAVCSEVLEHVDDEAGLLANVAACMGPGARLIVTVPGGPMSAFDRHLGHRRHYTRDGLRQILEGAGFRVETAVATGFPAFNLYRMAIVLRGDRLIDDVSGTPGPLARSAMALFGWLLRLPSVPTPWGWQIVAVARLKDAV